MEALGAFGCTCDNTSYLPTLEQLEQLSFQTSIRKSTNKLHLTDELLTIVQKDAETIYSEVLKLDFIYDYTWRVKSQDSLFRKYRKGISKSLRFEAVFNDIIGIRIHLEKYPSSFPNYFRIVDLRNGKKDYGGYKAIHLYYQKNHLFYTIEVQIWADTDYNFNIWSHEKAYKTVPSAILARVRKKYDLGLINSKYDFEEALK